MTDHCDIASWLAIFLWIKSLANIEKNHIFLRSIEKQQKLKIKPAYIFELTLVVICFSVWTTDRIGLKRAEWTTALPRVGNSDFHSAVVQFTVCLFLLLWGTEFWTVFFKEGLCCPSLTLSALAYLSIISDWMGYCRITKAFGAIAPSSVVFQKCLEHFWLDKK